jgi:hypothetical protein
MATSPPLVAGRRLLVITNRGAIEAYDVGAGAGEEPLTLVATRDAVGTQPLARHAAVMGRNVWVGDTQLTKFSILPTSNRLPVESIDNDFVGSAFDHPFESLGDTLIHVRWPKGRAGAIVAATMTASGGLRWETELAMPSAGPPVPDETAKALTVASAGGNMFRFDEAAIQSRVQDQSLSMPTLSTSPILTTSVDLGKGRAAFYATGSDRILLFNPALANRAPQWIKLESPLACPITPLGDGFIAPLSMGQVFYLSSADGAKLMTPFQPRLEPRTKLYYQPAGFVDTSARRFVIADGREKNYLVGAEDLPTPHLKTLAEATAGPYPISSQVFVFGNVALAVAGETHLVRFRLPTLEPAGELTLTAAAVWGPFPVSNAILLATADEQLTLISPAGEEMWRVPLSHGEPTGSPLVIDESVFVAYRNGKLERRAVTDGKVLATLDVEHSLMAGPVHFLRRLVLSATDGTLLVVDQP